MAEAVVASPPHVFGVLDDRSWWSGDRGSGWFKNLFFLFRILPLCVADWIRGIGWERIEAPKEIPFHGSAGIFPFVFVRVDVQLRLLRWLFLWSHNMYWTELNIFAEDISIRIETFALQRGWFEDAIPLFLLMPLLVLQLFLVESIVGVINVFVMLEVWIDNVEGRIGVGVSGFRFHLAIFFPVPFWILFWRILLRVGISRFITNVNEIATFFYCLFLRAAQICFSFWVPWRRFGFPTSAVSFLPQWIRQTFPLMNWFIRKTNYWAGRFYRVRFEIVLAWWLERLFLFALGLNEGCYTKFGLVGTVVANGCGDRLTKEPEPILVCVVFGFLEGTLPQRLFVAHDVCMLYLWK